MKIYIYPNDGSTNPSNKIEITNYVVDGVNEQKRNDDAFAITTFKAMLPESLFTLVKMSIQPFTIFEIESNNVSTLYFGSSEATKYLRPQKGIYYWAHDITLIHPNAVFEAIQIGTKTFTNHSDSYYLDTVLKALIQQKTGFTINFVGFTDKDNINKAYAFDKGSTAYSIMQEIYKRNNYWMNAVLSIDANNVYGNLTINVNTQDLDNPEIIVPNWDFVTFEKVSQNTNEFCDYLESQVDNVVDRNTTTRYSNLTVRSDDNNVTEENAFLELPEKVESIEWFEVFTEAIEDLYIYITEDMYRTLNDTVGLNGITFSQVYNGIRTAGYDPSWLTDCMDEIYNRNFYFNENDYKYFGSQVGYNYVLTGLRLKNGVPYSRVEKWYDIKKFLLEEKIYQGLTPNEQTSYCYYKSGDNKILGLYQYYKADWIHVLVGGSGTPMLQHCLDDGSMTAESDIPISQGASEYCRVAWTIENQRIKPTEVKFNVDAHPITSQYIIDKKTRNRNGAIIPISRSYDNSANYIDYDLMKTNIQIENESLGAPSITLQFLNNCNLIPNTMFRYGINDWWYVKSVVMNIHRNYITYDVNAFVNNNKQAECIGVKTQFESTKIALENIKERPLYFENNISTNIDTYESYYLLVDFCYSDNVDDKRTFLLPLSIYHCDTIDGITLVAKTVDNFSAGVYCAIGNQDNKYILKDAKYCDNNGEVYRITLSIVFYEHNISLDTSRALPNITDLNYTPIVQLTNRHLIYKDEHESLSFTIYLPNANLL